MLVPHGARTRAIVLAVALLLAAPVWPKAHALEAAQEVQIRSPEERQAVRALLATLRQPEDEPVPRDPVEVVLEVARAQLGKPYRYGTRGPSTFDCSGLVKFAWEAAGVPMPHGSANQRQIVTRVPLAEARPGDLVFSPGHVGIYIGDGQMIHAPRTGKTVEVSPLHSGANMAGRVLIT